MTLIDLPQFPVLPTALQDQLLQSDAQMISGNYRLANFKKDVSIDIELYDANGMMIDTITKSLFVRERGTVIMLKGVVELGYQYVAGKKVSIHLYNVGEYGSYTNFGHFILFLEKEG